MSDLTTLRDAFAELERRADAYPVHGDDTDVLRRDPRHRPMLFVAATVVAVVAVATGVALFAGGSGGDGAGQQHLQVGAPPHSSTASSPLRHPKPVGSQLFTWSPASSVNVRPDPRKSAVQAQESAAASRAASIAAARAAEPKTAGQLAARLRQILGNKATFTYTTPAGRNTAYIVGTMTRTDNGAVGGFDIQVNPGSPGDTAFCEDADTSHCKIRKLPDGSSLATGHESLQVGGGTLYLVDLVRRDGSNVLMHVSNNSDPKGGGTVAGNRPPLSIAEITKVVDSPKWG